MTPHVNAVGSPGLIALPLRTYVLPDLHGRLDLLDEALRLIDAEEEPGPYRVVFLGDYIDRGPESAGVIARLRAGPARPDVEWVCLRGNHEDLALSPDRLDGWLRNGGDAALASYEALPLLVFLEDLRWMAGLPLWFDDGVRLYVHAGVDPSLPLEEQDQRTLTWVRHHFLEASGFAIDRHIVHGHTPHWAGKPDAGMPELLTHRTNLDVAAYASGVLCIGFFDPGLPGGPVGFLRAEAIEPASGEVAEAVDAS